MRLDRDAILVEAAEQGASDLLFSVGHPVMAVVGGAMRPLDGTAPLSPEALRELVCSFLDGPQLARFEREHELDLRHRIAGVANFRVNLFVQQNRWGAAVRIVPLRVPLPAEIGLPAHIVERLLSITRGLILVTGPTGAGKSTTIASLLQQVNQGPAHRHVVTVEDPIEFTFEPGHAVIDQREVGSDTYSYATGLKGALRQLPHILFIGEMRDPESIAMALNAAETGNVVISTLSTQSAAQTVTRIVDSFPPHEQLQVRSQLAMVLKAVVSQVLLPRADGAGRVAAREVLFVTPAIQNLIREDKVHQIPNVMATGSRGGMVPLDDALAELVQRGTVTFDAAWPWFEDTEKRDALQRRLYRAVPLAGQGREAAR